MGPPHKTPYGTPQHPMEPLQKHQECPLRDPPIGPPWDPLWDPQHPMAPPVGAPGMSLMGPPYETPYGTPSTPWSPYRNTSSVPYGTPL